MSRQHAPLIILGIDPGLAKAGLGVIACDGQTQKALLAEAVSTPTGWPLARRLKKIHDAICEVAGHFRPDAAAIETLYFAANVRTAMQVAQARGAAILATADAGVELFEYTPLQIKQAVAGYGRAGKDQIIKMVQVLLHLKERPRSDHAADALAAALCHAQHQRMNRLIAGAERAERRTPSPQDVAAELLELRKSLRLRKEGD